MQAVAFYIIHRQLKSALMKVESQEAIIMIGLDKLF